jgi:hypothetical protein
VRAAVNCSRFLLLIALMAPTASAQSWSYQFNGATITDQIQFPDTDVQQRFCGIFSATNRDTSPLTFTASYPPSGPITVPNPILSQQVPVGGPPVSVNICFQPVDPGPVNATMVVNAHLFRLSGKGLVPSSFVTLQFSGALMPAQQVQVRVTLSQPFNVDLTGQVAVGFSAPGGIDDPALQFAIGGRTLPFTIRSGDQEAQFQNAGLQTGTVAGNLTLTTSFATSGTDVTPRVRPTESTIIAALAPTITDVRIDKQPPGFRLAITGYSTPRDVNKVTLQLMATPGATVTPSTVVDLDGLNFNTKQAFVAFYASPTGIALGSMFELTVPAAYTGDLAAIQSVTVAVSNSINTTTMNKPFNP